MAAIRNSVRGTAVAALLLTLVTVIGQRGPWLTSGDVQPTVWALFSIILPGAALVLGIISVRNSRRLAQLGRGDVVLAWAGLVLPAGLLSVKVLFVLGELLIGHS